MASRPLNEIAAIIHRDMVDDDRNGYSQAERYGEYGAWKELEIDGRTYRYQLGDRDCSSSVCEAWALALWHTPFAGLLDGATYTGNMRDAFVGSGLFDMWDTGSTDAETGDVYLNDVGGGHTAMCQTGGQDGSWDCLSEFSLAETGGIYGERGDQTGWEGHVCDFYWGGWDCTLHYNHSADDSFIDGGGEDGPTPPTRRKAAKYRARVRGEWCPLMVDHTDTGGSDDDFAGVLGKGIQYFACNYSRYRVKTPKGGWQGWRNKYDLKDLSKCAGDGSGLLYVEIASKHASLQVHVKGGGSKWLKAKKTADGVRAGDGVHLIDGIRLKRV